MTLIKAYLELKVGEMTVAQDYPEIVFNAGDEIIHSTIAKSSWEKMLKTLKLEKDFRPEDDTGPMLFISRKDAVLKIRGSLQDFERARNYELEQELVSVFGGRWCIAEWCPFNGIHCLLKRYVQTDSVQVYTNTPIPSIDTLYTRALKVDVTDKSQNVSEWFECELYSLWCEPYRFAIVKNAICKSDRRFDHHWYNNTIRPESVGELVDMMGEFNITRDDGTTISSIVAKTDFKDKLSNFNVTIEYKNSARLTAVSYIKVEGVSALESQSQTGETNV